MKVIQLNNGEPAYIDSFDSAMKVISENLSYELGEYLKEEIDSITEENEWLESENKKVRDGFDAAKEIVHESCLKLQMCSDIDKTDLLSDLLEIADKLC